MSDLKPTALQEAIQFCRDLQLDLLRDTGETDINLLTVEVKLLTLLEKEEKQIEDSYTLGVQSKKNINQD